MLSVLPVLLPFLAAVALLFLRHSRTAQAVLSGVAAHAALALAAHLLARTADGTIHVMRMGDWPGTFGIVFALDQLSALFIALNAVIHAATWWFVRCGGMPALAQQRYFHPLLLILAAGVNWAFATADLFNLFVSFELILLASYALMIFDNEAGQLRAGFRFVAMNVLGGTLFLLGAGLVYGTFGTLNYADLAIKVAQTEQRGVAAALAFWLLFVFGLKAAVFPLFFWLPGAYPKAPIGILPFFAGMLTKVGVYCFYRLYTVCFGSLAAEWTQPALLALAALTMVVGVFGALGQWSMRGILSVHIVSQIGYMVFGLAMFTTAGLAAGLFTTLHNVVVKTTLFLVAGFVVVHHRGDSVKGIHGLLRSYPWLGIAFLLAAVSLAGLPPLSGFYGKYFAVLEGFRTGHWFVAGAALFTSLFTLASMVKIWTACFWGERDHEPVSAEAARPLLVVAGGLAAVSVLVAVFSAPLMEWCASCAESLLDPRAYVEAVLGAPLPEGVVLGVPQAAPAEVAAP
ncbi:MAG: proton-conducting transporter membrane subunit [Candidatus Sumerlaeia bacterium]|nr:proton-conducting transporter membrane subunit [Candidatus Sumerlaeia bacterium]